MRVIFLFFACILNTTVFSQSKESTGSEKDTSIQAFIGYKFIESFHKNAFGGEIASGNGYVRFQVNNGALSKIVTNKSISSKLSHFLKQTVEAYFTSRDVALLGVNLPTYDVMVPVAYNINVNDSAENAKSPEFEDFQDFIKAEKDLLIVLQKVEIVTPFDATGNWKKLKVIKKSPTNL